MALDGLAFEVPGGQVFGFLGANGAGKTTTMRIVLGVLQADRGTVTWKGTDSRVLPRATWGYLPEERGLYPRMVVVDQLAYFASLYGLAPDRARREALHWLARFRVPELGRSARRGAVEGQPAEDPADRRDPPRPAGAPHGRAVHGSRSRQRRAASRGVPRAARPGPDADLLDPPDGDGRGALRVDRDRRSRAGRHRWRRAGHPAGGRSAPREDRRRGRSQAGLDR